MPAAGQGCSDTAVTGLWDLRDREEEELEGQGVLKAGIPKRYPRPCQQRGERSWTGAPAWDAPNTGH